MSAENNQQQAAMKEQQADKLLSNFVLGHVRAILIFFLLLMMGFAAVNAWQLYYIKSNSTDKALEAFRAGLNEQIETLTGRLKTVEGLVGNLAKDIHSGAVTVPDLEPRMRSVLEQNSWMHGFTIAQQSHTLVPEQDFWSLYFVRHKGPIKETPIDYDYRQFSHDWYRKPMLEGARWIEPYFGEASQTTLAEYTSPFWLPDADPEKDEPAGVITGNLSTENLRQLISFDNDLISYYVMISSTGRFIVHPDEEQVSRERSIFEYAWETQDAKLNSAAMHAVAGESGSFIHDFKGTHQEALVVYEKMPSHPWSLIVVIDRQRLLQDSEIRQQWFVLMPMLMLVASLLIILLFNFSSKLWTTPLAASIAVSLCIFAGVVGLWEVAERYPHDPARGDRKVISRNVLSSFQDQVTERAAGPDFQPVSFVSAGVYVKSLEFEDANTVQVSAYVWHHYDKGIHKGIRRGFVLPEGESDSAVEVFRELQDPNDPGCHQPEPALRDCTELIGWLVNARLRQGFDYSLYPLDSQQVWLRMWHEDFRKNVVLVPDLEAYSRPNPKGLPGVQERFVLPGWSIEESWFSVRDHDFNTNFGSHEFRDLGARPQLLYNIRIKREFINPFVSRVIPLILVAILMFLIVVISTKSKQESQWLGFSASSTIAGLSALFFVVGINHSELRQSLQSAKIMYFENFYFVVYLMLLYVAISSIRIAKQQFAEALEESQTALLIYWPSLAGVLFVVTFWVFF